MMAGFRRYQRLPAAGRRPAAAGTIGLGLAMSCAISRSTRFCAAVGLNGSIALIFSRTFSVQFESDARPDPAFDFFSVSPHSSQKNSSKIMRNWRR